MRHDRIPMIDGDEVDVFHTPYGYYVNDSGFRKSKAAIKKSYNKRARRLGKHDINNQKETS
jgi:hypothetical protein